MPQGDNLQKMTRAGTITCGTITWFINTALNENRGDNLQKMTRAEKIMFAESAALLVTSIALVIVILAYNELLLIGACLAGLFCLTATCCLNFMRY